MKYLFSFLLCGLLFNCSELSNFGYKGQSNGEELSDEERQKEQGKIAGFYQMQNLISSADLQNAGRTFMENLENDKLSITKDGSITHFVYDNEKLMRIEEQESEFKVHLFNKAAQPMLDNWDTVVNSINGQINTPIPSLNITIKIRARENSIHVYIVNEGRAESELMVVEKVSRVDNTKKVTITLNRALYYTIFNSNTMQNQPNQS